MTIKKTTRPHTGNIRVYHKDTQGFIRVTYGSHTGKTRIHTGYIRIHTHASSDSFDEWSSNLSKPCKCSFQRILDNFKHHTNLPQVAQTFVLSFSFFCIFSCSFFPNVWLAHVIIDNQQEHVHNHFPLRRHWGGGVYTVRDRHQMPLQLRQLFLEVLTVYHVIRDMYRSRQYTVFNFIIDDGIENTSFYYKR